MRRRPRSEAGVIASAVLLCALTACPGPTAPLATFSLDRYIILQPVLYLDDDRWFEGTAALVVHDSRTGRRALVTPAAAWPLPSSEVRGQLDRVELHTWGVPSRPLVTSTQLLGAVGGDQRDGLWAFAPPAEPSAEVRELQLAPRDLPGPGEVVFLVGCGDSSGTCVQQEHAITVVEVDDAGFSATPMNPGSTHAYGGSPVVTADGLLLGIFTRIDADGRLRAASVGLLRQHLVSGGPP